MKTPNAAFALIVHACDRYAFLYRGFDFFFKKYWDESIHCNKYFITEEKNTDIKGFKNIKSGKGEWSNRLKKALLQLKEDYVIYMQEDMWLAGKVNAELLNSLLAFSVKNNILQFKLHSSEVYVTIPTNDVFSGLRVGKVDNARSNFLMSHQITIWNREFLLKQLPKGEHPWRHERKGTKRLKKLDPIIYHIDLFAENGKPAINANPDEKQRSQYFTVSVNGVFSDNVLPLLAEMNRSSDAEMAVYALQIRHNFDNHLTHDGLAKPRKVDFFKRLRLSIFGK